MSNTGEMATWVVTYELLVTHPGTKFTINVNAPIGDKDNDMTFRLAIVNEWKTKHNVDIDMSEIKIESTINASVWAMIFVFVLLWKIISFPVKAIIKAVKKSKAKKAAAKAEEAKPVEEIAAETKPAEEKKVE